MLVFDEAHILQEYYVLSSASLQFQTQCRPVYPDPLLSDRSVVSMSCRDHQDHPFDRIRTPGYQRTLMPLCRSGRKQRFAFGGHIVDTSRKEDMQLLSRSISVHDIFRESLKTEATHPERNLPQICLVLIEGRPAKVVISHVIQYVP